MGNALSSFFYTAMHPFKAHKMIHQEKMVGLDYSEALTISWFFIIMQAGYSILAVMLGQLMTSYWQVQTGWLDLSLAPSFGQKDVFLIIWAMASILSFPVFSMFYIFFAKSIIKFCLDVYGVEEDQKAVDQVVAHSFCANIYLMIPIFGSLARTTGWSVYTYAGLREALGLSQKRAFFVIIAPFCLSSLVFMLSVTVFFLLISLTIY